MRVLPLPPPHLPIKSDRTAERLSADKVEGAAGAPLGRFKTIPACVKGAGDLK